MSIVRLPPTDDVSDSGSDASTTTNDGEEETWDDWVEQEAQPCKSLFDDTVLPSVLDAQKHDREVHGFEWPASLDTYGRIRLVNFIRKNKPTPAAVDALKGEEYASDEYLKPVLEDDPLLQIQPDEWSDSDSESPSDPAKRIAALERKLAAAKQDLVDYRALVSKQLDVPALRAAAAEDAGTLPVRPRDDDTHYFDSYGENDIHSVMLQDKVRTASYAHFILSNPALFTGATVLDVGCGTGILSLFAARAGAKRVFAVDASAGIVGRARRIVKANNLDSVITVIEGKIEDIVLPLADGEKVDVIISEWMGYALLYESMLDSVLHARDRFLNPAGVMAPSQCRMMLALSDPTDVSKERVDFWDDVYGFDLSVMKENVWDDAIVDVIGPEHMLSEAVSVKDLHLSTVTPSQLSFAAPFRLVSTADRRKKVSAFVLYFDTFFLPAPGTEHLPADTQVKVVREGDALLAEVWPVGARAGRPVPVRKVSRTVSGTAISANADDTPPAPAITSFSTGPHSVPTHWKQTLFLLREPVLVVEGTVISGHFHCVKSSTNSRELDVEIHYSVHEEGEEGKKGETVVQMYKVR